MKQKIKLKPNDLMDDGGTWMCRNIKRSLKHPIHLNVAKIDLEYIPRFQLQNVEGKLWEFTFCSCAIYGDLGRKRFYVRPVNGAELQVKRPTGYRELKKRGKMLFTVAIKAASPSEVKDIIAKGFEGEFKVRKDKKYTGGAGDLVIPLWEVLDKA